MNNLNENIAFTEDNQNFALEFDTQDIAKENQDLNQNQFDKRNAKISEPEMKFSYIKPLQTTRNPGTGSNSHPTDSL